MEGARDHEQAPGVGVEPPGGRVQVPALAVASLAVESHLQLGPLVHPSDDKCGKYSEMRDRVFLPVFAHVEAKGLHSACRQPLATLLVLIMFRICFVFCLKSSQARHFKRVIYTN